MTRVTSPFRSNIRPRASCHCGFHWRVRSKRVLSRHKIPSTYYIAYLIGGTHQLHRLHFKLQDRLRRAHTRSSSLSHLFSLHKHQSKNTTSLNVVWNDRLSNRFLGAKLNGVNENDNPVVRNAIVSIAITIILDFQLTWHEAGNIFCGMAASRGWRGQSKRRERRN